MKKVLLIIHQLRNGGAEQAITLLANTLREHCEITLVVFDGSHQDYIPQVSVIDLHSPKSRSNIFKLFQLCWRIHQIRKIKKQVQFDVAISFLPGPNLVNCLSRCNERVIISVRNMQSQLPSDKGRWLANYISFQKADKIVAVSQDVKEDILDNHKKMIEKTIVIPNMVDEDKIKNNQKEKIQGTINWQQDDFVILNMGRFIQQKGQWHLIKAMKCVTQKHPNAKLLLLGRGELEESFQNLIRILQLEKNIFLLGFQKNPYAYLQCADLYVSTSLYEGMPNVILEAMTCCIPIIATECLGGIREILCGEKDNYGVLISPLAAAIDISTHISAEEERLAQEILTVMEDKKKREKLAQLSQKRVKDFSCNVVKHKWINLIES